MKENIKKPLKEWLEDANNTSNKLSDINRSLAFAAIAIIWIFRSTENIDHIIPENLLFPLLLIIISLTFDYLQYLWKSIFIRIFYRNLEKKYNKKELTDTDIEDVQISGWCPNITLLFFYFKIIFLVLGYFYIFKFLIDKM